MSPANINITNSIPDWENKLRASLEQAGFNDQRQGKIIGDIASELQKKGTTKPIEKDIFEAASEAYKFNNKTNLGLAKAIDGLDGETNIQLSESNAKWQLVGANNKNSSSGSIPDWEIKLQASLEQAGFKDPERQGKIIGDIANELQKKGTTKPIEKDIFEAASEVYEFNNKINLGLAKAIDDLDGETNTRNPIDDSLNMVRSSIEKIKKTDPKFTVDDIIQDLENREVIVLDGQGEVTKNKHLHDNLVVMSEQGFTGKDIEEATKNDPAWRNLLGTVKETEFQRQLIQDSIKNIKKTEFTVDDIINSLQKENKLDDELRNNLTAMKKQGVTAQKIIEVTQTDLAWNTFIGTVKKPSETAP
jgi:hypothetical protein